MKFCHREFFEKPMIPIFDAFHNGHFFVTSFEEIFFLNFHWLETLGEWAYIYPLGLH